MRVPDASAWFPGPCGSSWRGSGLAPGEFGIVKQFRDFLTRSGLSLDL